MARILTLSPVLAGLLVACGTGPSVELESPVAVQSALTTGAPADAIIGQLSERATASRRTDAGSIAALAGVAVGGGHLFVADSGNARVLGYEDVSSLNSSTDNGADADLVLLQPDMFVKDHRNIPTAPINHAITPAGVEVDPEGRLYVWNTGNVLVFDDPFDDDGVAEYELAGEPDTIRSVRALSNNKLAVVGTIPGTPSDSHIIVFYERGLADPYAQATITSPCGAYMTDIAETIGVFFVACGATDVYVFAVDAVTGLPKLGSGNAPPPGYQAYTDMYGITSIETAAGYLLVADTVGNRVIRFASAGSHASAVIGAPTTTPSEVPADDSDRIYGQPDYGETDGGSTMPNYDSSYVETVSADGLYAPGRLSVDSDGRIWLADVDNNRVLGFSDARVVNPDKSAKVVLGQADMAHNFENRLEPSSFVSVAGVAIGTNGGNGLRAAAADPDGNRVLIWNDVGSNSAGTPADAVLGQASRLDAAVNRGGTIANNGLNAPTYAAVDASGDVWVNDAGNNRILHFSASSDDASQAFGASGLTTGGVIGGFRGFAVTETRVFIAAGSRVLMYEYERNRPNDSSEDPSRVFGQDQPETPTVIANDCNRDLGAGPDGPSSVPPRADSLCGARDVAVDGEGTLWVADTGNKRVLWFEDPTSDDLTAAVTADGVVGQPDFVTNQSYGGAGIGPFGFSSPADIAVDDAGTLWVLDSADSRVLVFPSPKDADPEVGMPMATTVLGQPDHRSRGANNDPNDVNAGTLSGPTSVAVDRAGSTALIADAGNNRVLRFVDNHPPVIEDSGRHEVSRGDTLTVQVTVTDPEHQGVTVEGVEPLPPGASVNNTSVRYTAPASAPVGTIARVNVVATDSGQPPQSTTGTVIFVVVDRIPSAGGKPQPRPLRTPASGCTASPAGAGALLALLGLPLVRRRRRQASA